MGDVPLKYFIKKTINCPHCHKDIDLKNVHITQTKEYYGDKRVPLPRFGVIDDYGS